MNFIVSLLAGFVSSGVLKALVTRVLVLLGISAVTYTGISAAFSYIEGQINSNIGSMSANLVTMLMLLKIPNAMDVVMSAYVGALTLRGLTAVGAVTKYGVSSAAGSVFSPGTF